MAGYTHAPPCRTVLAPPPLSCLGVVGQRQQYVSKLADNLNAEIVQGTVQSVADATQWLGYTYLYVRMMQNPDVYRVPPDEIDKDPVLRQFRVDLVSDRRHRHRCSFFFFFLSRFAWCWGGEVAGEGGSIAAAATAAAAAAAVVV